MERDSKQYVKINGTEYVVIDAYENFRAEDSFIHRFNKLSQFKGNAEAKKHMGTYAGEQGEKLSSFFDYDKWGIAYKDPEKNQKTMSAAEKFGAIVQYQTCCFSKSNLLHYLEDARQEYFDQEQEYHNDIGLKFQSRHDEIAALPNEYLWFSIYDTSDNHSEQQNRAYIRSDDPIWRVWRTLILPKISYLSILKLAPIDSELGHRKPIFYFQIQLDYQFRSFVHPSLVRKFTSAGDANSPVKRAHRQGADKYRRGVLDHMGRCPFTLITDERLLIASHIKPYVVCMNEGREDQALDHLNGLALSPTYDKLFDQGFITFTDRGELICSTLLSPMTWSRLQINPALKRRLQIFPDDREVYLGYHRQYIFQGAIDELI